MYKKIVNNSSFEYYHIKIYMDYKREKNHIKIGEEYISDSKLFKKVYEKSRKILLIRKKRNKISNQNIILLNEYINLLIFD